MQFCVILLVTALMDNKRPTLLLSKWQIKYRKVQITATKLAFIVKREIHEIMSTDKISEAKF